MTTIAQNSAYATLINVFTVEPEHAGTGRTADHVDRGSDAASARLPVGQHPPQHRPHPRRQLRAMGQRRGIPGDAGRRHRTRAHGEAAAIATGFDPHLYTVESVHGRTLSRCAVESPPIGRCRASAEEGNDQPLRQRHTRHEDSPLIRSRPVEDEPTQHYPQVQVASRQERRAAFGRRRPLRRGQVLLDHRQPPRSSSARCSSSWVESSVTAVEQSASSMRRRPYCSTQATATRHVRPLPRCRCAARPLAEASPCRAPGIPASATPARPRPRDGDAEQRR